MKKREVTMLRKRALVAVCLVLTACAVPVKQMQAVGGSRADGTIKMSYEYGRFEQPQVNIGQGAAVAKGRCAAWGYTGAEPFGGQTKECVLYSNSTCERFKVITEYQCTGTPPSSR